MRAFAPGGGLDVLRGGGTPAWGWRLAVEGGVLVRIEQIQHGAWHAGQAAEILDRRRRDVDTADAAEHRLHISDTGGAAVEAACPAAEPGEEMEVADLVQFGESLGTGHVTPSPLLSGA